MAKTSMIQKNLQRKNHVTQASVRREELKRKIYDKSLSQEERFDYVMALAKMSRDGSIVRVRNRCIISGRPRGVYRKFGLCRVCFRERASQGKLPGIRKSSW